MNGCDIRSFDLTIFSLYQKYLVLQLNHFNMILLPNLNRTKENNAAFPAENFNFWIFFWTWNGPLTIVAKVFSTYRDQFWPVFPFGCLFVYFFHCVCHRKAQYNWLWHLILRLGHFFPYIKRFGPSTKTFSFIDRHPKISNVLKSNHILHHTHKNQTTKRENKFNILGYNLVLRFNDFLIYGINWFHDYEPNAI